MSDSDGGALTQFLARRNEPCPWCGFNLRGLTSTTCPECGYALQLELVGARQAKAAMVTGAIPLLVAASFGLLGVVVMVATLLVSGWSGTGMSWSEVGKYAFSLCFSAWILVLWVRHFRCIHNITGTWRWLLVATCYLYAAVGLTITNTFHP